MMKELGGSRLKSLVNPIESLLQGGMGFARNSTREPVMDQQLVSLLFRAEVFFLFCHRRVQALNIQHHPLP